MAPLNEGKACTGPRGCRRGEDACPATTTKTATTKTKSTTTKTTTITTTTTTIFDPGNVDCVEEQDDCTAACEAGADRNYAVVVASNKLGKICRGASDCRPGDGLCPATSTTTTVSATSTTTTAKRIKKVGWGVSADDDVGYYDYGGGSDGVDGDGDNRNDVNPSGGAKKCKESVDPAECLDLGIVSCVGAIEAAEAVRNLCPILCKECLVEKSSIVDPSAAASGKKSTGVIVGVLVVLLLLCLGVGMYMWRKWKQEKRFQTVMGRRYNGQATGIVNTTYEHRRVPHQGGASNVSVQHNNPTFDAAAMVADNYEEPCSEQADVYDDERAEGGGQRRRSDTVSGHRNRTDSVTVTSGATGVSFVVPLADEDVYTEPNSEQPDVYDGENGYDLPVTMYKAGPDGYDHPVEEYDGTKPTIATSSFPAQQQSTGTNSYQSMPASGYEAPKEDYGPSSNSSGYGPAGQTDAGGGGSNIVYSTYDEGSYETMNPGTLGSTKGGDYSSYTISSFPGNEDYEPMDGSASSEWYEPMEGDGQAGGSGKCTRPSPSGGSCRNDAVEGTLFCTGHTCSAPGCTAGKSGREAACPAHTKTGTGDDDDAYGALDSSNSKMIAGGGGGTSSKEGGKGSKASSNKCTRPTPSGGMCKNARAKGSLFCQGHTCPASGCTFSKSAKESECPAHASPSETGRGRTQTKWGNGGVGGGGAGSKVSNTNNSDLYGSAAQPSPSSSKKIGSAKCTRPSPSGGSCKNDAVEGTLFCTGHTCSAPGCTAGKSGREAACPAHTTTGTGSRTGAGGGKGKQVASRGLQRKVSVYSGFEENAAAPGPPPRTRGGIRRDARGGSVYAGFEASADDMDV